MIRKTLLTNDFIYIIYLNVLNCYSYKIFLLVKSLYTYYCTQNIKNINKFTSFRNLNSVVFINLNKLSSACYLKGLCSHTTSSCITVGGVG